MTNGLIDFILVSVALLAIGIYGIAVKRNAIRMLFGIEMIVNSANLNLVAFSIKGSDKDSRTEIIEKAEEDKLRKDEQDEIRIIKGSAVDKLKKLLIGKTAAVKIEGKDGKGGVAKGKKITEEAL